jgi:hypothetical protein
VVNAQANLNRYVPLLAKGYATSQLVDTQKAQVAQLQAMIKSDEAVIESARRYPRRTANHPECTRHGAAGNLAIVHVKPVPKMRVLFQCLRETFVCHGKNEGLCRIVERECKQRTKVRRASTNIALPGQAFQPGLPQRFRRNIFQIRRLAGKKKTDLCGPLSSQAARRCAAILGEEAHADQALQACTVGLGLRRRLWRN